MKTVKAGVETCVALYATRTNDRALRNLDQKLLAATWLAENGSTLRLGMTFFHAGQCLCKLSCRPRLVSRKCAVLQEVQGAKPSPSSLCGWKTLRVGFPRTESGAPSLLLEFWHFVFLLKKLTVCLE